MLNREFDPVIDYGWIPSSAWKCTDSNEEKGFAQKKANVLDYLPAMSATVLGLEMLLHEPCIDLQMASDLVLSDVGATIQILRLIGKEYDFATERPNRMGDCIASLEVSVWFGAVSARTFASDPENSATIAVWKHCRLVAQYAQLVAESLKGISPEDAYLVGLLHEIGTIPTLLGWSNDGADASASSAMKESLPPFVLNAMSSANDSCGSSPWRFILTAAHELASAQTDIDAFDIREMDSVGTSSSWFRFLPSATGCISVSSGMPSSRIGVNAKWEPCAAAGLTGPIRIAGTVATGAIENGTVYNGQQVQVSG